MTALILRPARPTDAGAVGAILSGFIDGTAWMPRIHTRAEDLSFADTMIGRGWVTVAEDEGGIVGFSARNAQVVHCLYVAADHRNAGYGTALLDEMKGASGSLSLWTFEANTGAQRFYLRHGFAETERTDGAGNDEGLPDIHYAWRKGAIS